MVVKSLSYNHHDLFVFACSKRYLYDDYDDYDDDDNIFVVLMSVLTKTA